MSGDPKHSKPNTDDWTADEMVVRLAIANGHSQCCKAKCRVATDKFLGLRVILCDACGGQCAIIVRARTRARESALGVCTFKTTIKVEP